jgi:tRNA(Ile)-lysidine synthase
VCIPEISAALARCLAQAGSARYCVAFSGGLDSTALLYLMARWRAQHSGAALRALHVNHHLLAQAGQWAEHCRRVAAQLHTPLEVLDVQVALGPGVSTEAAARDARYAILKEHLAADEVLLTAHHQDDQLETVLLQLLRGAGVAGLSAMPERTAFGRGHHIRPLLGCSRADLEAVVGAAGLDWVQDSSNTQLQFDRNYMRQRVLPLLRERWPRAAATVARTAGHMAEAQSLLEELARIDLAAAGEGEALKVDALKALSPPRARNLLRYWIRAAGLRPPSTVKLDEIFRQMLHSRVDALPRVEWEGAAIMRHRGRLRLEALSS